MRQDAPASFSRLVAEAMAARGLGLRELCRQADLDPSFFSKVLTGKRNPPSDEAVLRRLAAALDLPAVTVIVSAGLIPTDWSALRTDADLLRRVHALAARAGEPRPARRPIATAPHPEIMPPPRAAGGLSEELL